MCSGCDTSAGICRFTGLLVEVCCDGIDNDDNGLTDGNDLACANATCAPVSCMSDADCGSLEVCTLMTSMCVPREASCTSDAECAVGQF